jgi:uncharacterized circularly permuted ATP-grasp superfamily protein/uncharacterized alpha-E superfamily protein
LDRTALDRGVGAWISGYHTIPGIPDELIGADGRPRAHWTEYLEALSVLGGEGVEQRFASAARRIEDLGVSYRVPGETRERSWPLGRLPLLLPEAEWNELEQGVVQRAELLDLVLKDIYGEGRMIAAGALPAAAVAGSPDFIRPMRGATPAGGRWLRIYAADVGRGPDGKWWVLGDRAQAPSGAGYALQNRLVLSGAFPGLYQDMKTRRLAPFFRDFRQGLATSAERAEPRICLLTPGPWSATYAEQVILARYLGLVLVEGEDLVTSEGRLFVRTIAGLKRADVVLRRLDADWCDPLELNAASRLGVPGMLEAVRGGSVAMANMPGAGYVESRALMSFLPVLARRMLGEELRLPNVATWWCGQEREREETLAALEERAIAGAFIDGTPGFAGNNAVVGAELDEGRRAALAAAIRERGVDFVGQEVVRLSTTPTWEEGGLKPRPFALRVYAAATRDGWRVMPGGLCRISDRLDVRAVSMDAGAKSADVWVLGRAAAEPATLLPRRDDAHIARMFGSLPSRAADNLFWMSRYLERAEATLRVVRCLCGRATEARGGDSGGDQPVERLRRLLLAWGAVRDNGSRRATAAVAFAAATDAEAFGSVLSVARQAKRAAAIVRERLSQDVWQLMGRVEELVERLADNEATEPQILERSEAALHALAGLSGLFNENFNRVAGWAFIELGRRIERAINTCRLARQLVDADPAVESLDALMDLIDSQITYRSRYMAGTAVAPLLDMAILDPFNPRSVAFQMARVDEALAGLPSLLDDGVLEPQRRASVKLRAQLATEDARRLDAGRILVFEQRLIGLANAVGERFFSQGARLERADKGAVLA